MKRKISKRKVDKSIFIISQGQVTEPEYFKYFQRNKRIVSLDIKVNHENESDALKFVKKSILRYNDYFSNYDECWLIFDKDETPDNSFNEAIKFAEKKKWHVAYSNQAFEFWFILHFELYKGQLHRSNYKNRLTSHIGFQYLKNDKNSLQKLCELLESKLDDAIKNAETVFHSFIDQNNPAQNESSTTVHFLVKEIKNFLKQE